MLQNSWKTLIIGFGLFSFLITLLFTGGKDSFWNAIALGGLMIFFWIFEVIPIYLTALFPVVLAIPLGVLDKSQLAAAYGNSSVFLFLGGFVLALGLEKWNVHQQVAKRIIAVVGKSKKSILLGFIFSTGLLSMWISNTATALMMLPMALAIIGTEHSKKSKFPLLLLLSVATSSSIGGLGTLVGSPPNVQMASILQSNFDIYISFSEWMKMGIPLSILLLTANFFLFNFLMGKERHENIHEFSMEKEAWSKEQLKVSAIFGIVVILWVFKDLIGELLGVKYGDEMVAILGAILLFVVPVKGKKNLLEWKDTEKLPWGILLLFGGGLALAQILETNGIITEISNSLLQFQNYPVFWIMFIVVFIAIFATEVLSNLALVTVLIPVVANFAISAGLPIIPITMALTFGASCAFMLPIGTPPNAIVFSSGHIHMNQMVKIGFLLNIIALLTIVLYNWLLF